MNVVVPIVLFHLFSYCPLINKFPFTIDMLCAEAIGADEVQLPSPEQLKYKILIKVGA